MESGNLSISKIKAFTSTVTMHQSKHNNIVLGNQSTAIGDYISLYLSPDNTRHLTALFFNVVIPAGISQLLWHLC